MKLLTTEDYINNDTIDKEIMNNYCLVRDNIKKFENNSNEEIFEFLFNNEGERLWELFVLKCNRNIHDFLLCLTTEQRNIFYVNVNFNFEFQTIIKI